MLRPFDRIGPRSRFQVHAAPRLISSSRFRSPYQLSTFRVITRVILDWTVTGQINIFKRSIRAICTYVYTYIFIYTYIRGEARRAPVRKLVRDPPLRTIFRWTGRGEAVASFQEPSARGQWKHAAPRALSCVPACYVGVNTIPRIVFCHPSRSTVSSPLSGAEERSTILIRPMGSLTDTGRSVTPRHSDIHFEMSRTRSILVRCSAKNLFADRISVIGSSCCKYFDSMRVRRISRA